MIYTPQDIADALDLAVLKPTATLGDVGRTCDLANKYRIHSVCVAPCNAAFAARLFKNTSVVIGFPHGNSTPVTKLYEATGAINVGAKELDVVINYGHFLYGDWEPVEDELSLLVPLAHEQGVLVKAILETCYYSKKQITEACHICTEQGVDFVKTSTGFADGANRQIVETMVEAVRGKAQVKASGGIATYADVACISISVARGSDRASTWSYCRDSSHLCQNRHGYGRGRTDRIPAPRPCPLLVPAQFDQPRAERTQSRLLRPGR